MGMSRFASTVRFVALVIALIWCVACNPSRALDAGGDGGEVMVSAAGGGDSTMETTPVTYSAHASFDFDSH